MVERTKAIRRKPRNAKRSGMSGSLPDLFILYTAIGLYYAAEAGLAGVHRYVFSAARRLGTAGGAALHRERSGLIGIILTKRASRRVGV